MANVFRNDFSNGEVIEVELTADATSGVPFDFGGRVGIPLTDGVSGDIISVKINGVVELPKTSAATFAPGTPVDWNGTELNSTGGTGSLVDGFIPLRTYGSGTTSALVLLAS